MLLASGCGFNGRAQRCSAQVYGAGDPEGHTQFSRATIDSGWGLTVSGIASQSVVFKPCVLTLYYLPGSFELHIYWRLFHIYYMKCISVYISVNM